MYDDILVPTDGGESAEGAVAEAVELAAVTGARLHALSVVDTRSYSTLSEAKWLLVDEMLREEAETAVRVVRERAEEAGVDVTTTVERGVPHEIILDYAAEHGVDLVVMGTHGRRGIDHVLLGSVAERVVRRSSAPVLIVRQGSE
jgi:nucleotide-binding universal stress UspA family protein